MGGWWFEVLARLRLWLRLRLSGVHYRVFYDVVVMVVVGVIVLVDVEVGVAGRSGAEV